MSAGTNTNLRTNAELLGYFLPAIVEIEGETGEPGRVRVEGTRIPTPGNRPKNRER